MIVALWGRDQLAEDSGVEDAGGWGGVTLAYNVGSPAEVDAVIAEAEAAGRDDPASRRRDVLGRLLGRLRRSRTAIRGRSPTTRTGGSPRTVDPPERLTK